MWFARAVPFVANFQCTYLQMFLFLLQLSTSQTLPDVPNVARCLPDVICLTCPTIAQCLSNVCPMFVPRLPDVCRFCQTCKRLRHPTFHTFKFRLQNLRCFRGGGGGQKKIQKTNVKIRSSKTKQRRQQKQGVA